MNITITVIGDTDSPDVQNLLAHLAKTISATIAVAEPVKTETIKGLKKGAGKTGEINAEEFKNNLEKGKDSQVVETPAAEETPVVETAPADKPKHSAEEVRAAAVAKSKINREEVKALIESFGTPNLAGLKPEQFNEFMAKLEKI